MAMGDSLKLRTGGQQVVDALLAQGSDTVFGVPGESYSLRDIWLALRNGPATTEQPVS